MTRYEGPCKIDCPLTCDVPAGVVMSEVPRPRHAWSDVLVCPNADEGCERTFLVSREEEAVGEPKLPADVQAVRERLIEVAGIDPNTIDTLAVEIADVVRRAHTASDGEIKRMPIATFVAEGYLFEINRRFLHPLGLALEWFDPEDPALTACLGGVWDYRDDPEGVNYGPETLAANASRAVNVARLEKRRINARTDALGYWVQHVEGVID